MFVVLYVVDVVGLSASAFGALVALQATTSIASYLLLARFADHVGRKPSAFVVGGLREVGEPARKAMIVDLVRPVLRARSVGLYYLVRSLAIAPAAFIGGLLWRGSPAVPFWVAGAIGLVGVIVFAATVKESQAGLSAPPSSR